VSPERKTLSIRTGDDAAEGGSSVNKKGRGWEISDKRLDALHQRAREMRRNPTPAQDALAEALGGVETGGYAFKRQQVIGSAIVDFACKPLMLVLELDGDEDAPFAADRDRSLTEVGYRVERLPAADVLVDPAAAAARVSATMRERYFERRERMKQDRPTRAPRRPREY
jgi:very-short-patch-repair endonuclease